MDLLEKIETRQATVAVIGLGYVGLPLAVAFAEAGFRVVGIDVDQERVDALNRGESYVSDVPSETLARYTLHVERSAPSVERDILSASKGSNMQRTNGLSATTDYNALHDADAAIICVPTPLSKTKDPDMSHIISVTGEIARRLHRDMLIVLESTTYPGTTEELILPHLASATRRGGDQERGRRGDLERGRRGEGEIERHSDGLTPSPRLPLTPPPAHPVAPSRPQGGQPAVENQQALRVGRDFFLAFSPERIDPGRTDYTIYNTPKVIGGVTPACTRVAQALYECAIQQVVPVSSPRVAEMVKLLENTFRAVNIALVNEVAIMCDRLGIDVWEVVEAADSKPFGFMTFYPGPGLGGHCIPIDPQYLAWKLKTVNYNARFIQLAGEINFGMPQYVLGKIADALNEAGKPINGSRILILGVAYKADVGDLRESPALDLIHLLQAKGADVQYHDPYVPRLDADGIELAGVALDRDTVQATDCVVITAAHSSYNWQWIVDHSRLVIDTRNATRAVSANAGRIVRL